MKWRRVAAVLLTAVSALGAVAVTATPAGATTWYQKCHDLPLDGVAWCIESTGGWPSGYVRAQVPAHYGVKLQECHTSGCGPLANGPQGPVVWNDVAVAVNNPYNGNTPSVRAGKFSSYRPCAQLVYGAAWHCVNLIVYLGD